MQHHRHAARRGVDDAVDYGASHSTMCSRLNSDPELQDTGAPMHRMAALPNEMIGQFNAVTRRECADWLPFTRCPCRR
jgi:hypothetical protein